MIGIVTSGKKRAKNFMSMVEYKKQFKEKLGLNPYAGTLNILSPHKKILEEMDGIMVEGFVRKGKKYGRVKCFPVKIGRIKAAIVIPEKSREDYLEIISKYNLRKKLKIEDGDKIEIKFVPFLKWRRKYLLDCEEGREKATLKIYYESPLLKNPLIEGCNEGKGNKVLPSRMVASLIFEGEEKENFKKLLTWTKKRYSIMYPPVLIDYGSLKEWQLEIKWNDG